MKETYEACKEVSASTDPALKKKSGKKARIHEMLRARVMGLEEETSIFISVLALISDDFEAIVDEWQEVYYTPELKNAYDLVLADFDQRFVVTEEIKSEADEEAVEQLKDAAKLALDKIHGQIKMHIDLCEEFENGSGQ